MEFQSRREFEAFSSFPDYLSAGHQVALAVAAPVLGLGG